MTQGGYAKREGLRLCSLRGWLYRKRRDEAQQEGTGFAAVKLRNAVTATGTVTVRWPSGVEVEVSPGTDAVSIVHLVRELVKPCSA
jgi:hypothetical protein